MCVCERERDRDRERGKGRERESVCVCWEKREWVDNRYDNFLCLSKTAAVSFSINPNSGHFSRSFDPTTNT